MEVFLVTLVALFAAAQAITEQIKQRVPYLRTHRRCPPRCQPEEHAVIERAEAHRQLAVRLISAGVATAFAYVLRLDVLTPLGAQPIWSNLDDLGAWGSQVHAVLDATVAGCLAAFGGPLFNEILDVLTAAKTQLQRLRSHLPQVEAVAVAPAGTAGTDAWQQEVATTREPHQRR